MNKNMIFTDTKPHYELLDGLRGVAALIVVCYHIFEGFSFAEITNGAGDGMIHILNHGYLAVDFFFLLSGFVLSYAYDGRSEMKKTDFFKRRLIRLHPMLVMGAFVGMICFLIGGSQQWNGTQVPFYLTLLCFVLSALMLPAIPSSASEVRGNGEMFPLNGPAWSLFFEYIGNILYILFIRRLSTKILGAFVLLLGVLHTVFSLGNFSGYGSIGVGWTLDGVNFCGGLIRMLFPLTLGMFLSRRFKPLKIKSSFWTCSLLLLIVFSVPYIPGFNFVSFNGLYESICVLIFFPLILIMGASAQDLNRKTNKINHFLGDLSYPLYMIHYPIMYLFYQWLIANERYTLSETSFVAIPVVVLSVLLAFLFSKFYDKPLRKYLTERFNRDCR
ncbi:MAG: acyltransferase [Bacteroidales bacterium]|nr:acyltransferase [Bacteroidales bacterium]